MIKEIVMYSMFNNLSKISELLISLEIKNRK